VGYSGNTVIVGGSQVWTAPAGRTGAAYIFVRGDREWIVQQRLTPSSGWAVDDLFGQAVAIEGDIAVVGAPGRDDSGSQSGATFVFRRTGTVWAEVQRLIPSGAFANMRFGTDVAIDRGTIVVGAAGHDVYGTDAGAAYVFVPSGTMWTEQQMITASDAAAYDYLGDAVAIQGDTAVVGARGDDDRGSASGSVYVFQRIGGFWTQTRKLTGSTTGVADEFGSALDLDGALMVVGAYGEYDSRLSGAIGTAYVFAIVDGSWTEAAQLFASDPGADDQLGRRVAITGNTVFAGAHQDDEAAANAGAVYVYQMETVGQPCRVPTECATEHCVDGVCCNLACGDGAPDDCQACSIEAGGVANGLCGPLSAAAAPTVVCRRALDTCDVAEVCAAGSMACPSNGIVEAMIECRAAMRPCDVAEFCTGVSPYCPTDGFVAFGTVCNASTGDCDPAEVCTGLGPDCPADALSAAETVCREAAGPCDAAETCSGESAGCPADSVRPAGTECRPAIHSCDAHEVCDGTSADCPADEVSPDGTPCDDGLICNGVEVCTAGACMLGPIHDCDDGDACTFDTCLEPTGCVHYPIETCCNEEVDCDDGDRCTRDVCSGPGGTCMHAPIATCCWNDADCNDRDPCTMDRCAAGVCTHGWLTGCCAIDADCDDEDSCTQDACVGLRCVYVLSPDCVWDGGPDGGTGPDADTFEDAGPDSDLDAGADADADEHDADIDPDDSTPADGGDTDAENETDGGHGGPGDGCGCRIAGARQAEHSLAWWIAQLIRPWTGGSPLRLVSSIVCSWNH
jgi:hypothetical protein